jgi:hypothetical protein
MQWAFLEPAGLAVFAALGFWVHPGFWLGAVPALFFRAILREFGLLQDLDEREYLLSLRASHWAFILTLMLATAYVLVSPSIAADRTNQEIAILLFVPLAVRFFLQLGMTYSPRRAGTLIGLLFGTLWLLFAVLSHGISAGTLSEGAIGLIILGTALLSWFFPKPAGILFFLEALVAGYFVMKAGQLPSVRFILMLLFPLPLFLCGILLCLVHKEEGEITDAD